MYRNDSDTFSMILKKLINVEEFIRNKSDETEYFVLSTHIRVLPTVIETADGTKISHSPNPLHPTIKFTGETLSARPSTERSQRYSRALSI